MAGSLDDTLDVLRKLKPQLAARFGVTGLAVFGSTASAEAGPTSDVDILLRFAPDATLTLFALADLDAMLAERLGRAVDTVPEDCLSPRLAPYIAADLVEV
jgi:predicted nucleotidyltransferase